MSSKPSGRGNIKFFYITSCGHLTTVFLPTVFSCHACHKNTVIIDVHVFEWHAYCTHDRGSKGKCRFSAWTGTSEIFAQTKAMQHYHMSTHSETRYILETRPQAVAEKKRLTDNHLFPSIDLLKKEEKS